MEQALDKRSSMGIIGNLGAYSQFQAANAMEVAAANPNGGLMGAGLAAGMGVGMMNQMGNVFQPQQVNPPAAGMTPPPLPPVDKLYFVAVNGVQTGGFRLSQLHAMVQSGQLTRASLVWTQGMTGWLAAETQAELAGLFAAMPPPL